MRQDSVAFAAQNISASKRPRYVIEVAFDSANTILWYFTSHTDCAVPGGGGYVYSTVEGLSGTSQTLAPDKANASIGNINFSLVDDAGIVTSTLGGQLVLGRSTRRQRVRVYVGFEGLAWSDYTLAQTQLVSEITYKDGAYNFRCMDVQREMRKDIFDPAKTTLAQTLSAAATAIEVYSAAAFAMVAHGTSYSDAPSATVGYVKIEKEVIRYTGKTGTQFTGCTRGALNTLAVEHVADTNATADRRLAVEEHVYLELPALKLIYALLTGVLHGQGGATLPASWHLGIPTSYVRLADFTDSAKADLWNPANDGAGFLVRFDGLKKTDGKKFIESELALLSGVFMPVYADGALGLKRMANMLAGAAYVQHLTESNVVGYGDLLHDFNALHNVLQIEWNWEAVQDDFTRVNLLLDADSITIHGRADTLKLKFRGLHGSLHSSTILSRRFDALRDRFTGPPLTFSIAALPSLNVLEVGDVVRVDLEKVRDFVANSSLDRSFEIQNISIDWITGNVNLKLFASSRAPKELAATSDATVLSNSWYTSQGTALSSVLTITGSNPGHVTAGGTLTGTADMTAAGSVFYYDGDLVIDPGVTVNLVNNVQLRVRGALQNNGTLSGVGAGLAGATAPNPPTSDSHHVAGTTGFIGTTEAGGSIWGATAAAISSVYRGASVIAPNSTMPSFDLAWSGTALFGLPTDLRGSSGSSGMPGKRTAVGNPFGPADYFKGGNGAAGGAGLLIVCRGLSFGVAGKINLSGANGGLGTAYTYDSAFTLTPGSGGGGAPGGFLILLDGTTATATGLTAAAFIAQQGTTPIVGERISAPQEIFGEVPWGRSFYSYFIGTGDGTTFPLPNLSGARGGVRVQYIPGSGTVAADPAATVLAAPTNFGLASGSDQLLVGGDGTITVRIYATWVMSLDPRVAGYDLQFKRLADSVWSSAPPIIGSSTASAWIAGVRDGIEYDIRLRAAGGVRDVSEWVTIGNYTVVGKAQPPATVGALIFAAPFLKWPENADADLRGYIVRYQAGSNTDWVTAAPAHTEGFITETQFDTSEIVGGSTTMLVKSLDTSWNDSISVSSLLIDLRPPTPTSFLVSTQPDGTREFTWALMSPPSDLDGYRIRYYLGTTSDWSAMTAMHTGLLLASPFESNQLAAGTYTFAIKSVDVAGNESANALFIATTIGDPRIAGAVEDISEAPAWTGTKTSCHVDATTGWLVADGTGTWTSLPATWAGWTVWNTAPVSPIAYMRQIDIGVKTKFVPLVTVTVDGTPTLEEQHGDDDVTYSSYAAIGPKVDARYIRVRATVTGSYPKIKIMRTILSANPITEIVEDVTSSAQTGNYRIGTGDVRVPIVKNFIAIKKVDITLQSVGGGWTWELIDKTTTYGPRIKIYNASNVLADAVYDATIMGL